MSTLYRDHLLEIAKCPNFLNCQNTPCQKIVEYQNGDIKQLPEPWSGDIQKAKILFISSNPSIDPNEMFPTSLWTESEIVDFFNFRFSKQKKYVRNYLYPQQKNNEYSEKWVRYWAAIRKISIKLLRSEQITPGEDYAITEIVRCKSHKEIGVKEAIDTCSDRFLAKTITLTNAKILIAVGKKAKEIIERKFKIEIPNNSFCKMQIGEIEKIVLAIPHPNSRGEKSLEKLFNESLFSYIVTA